ncbi:MAG: transcriptional regulator [Actinobacteria bacterium HGW-Actinobacteria-5]|jgi:predicted NBD/HSP70 family sugar kinase|nr:MAG: transcriptional regulator [Actinobacteria bacterium HGW-Actinobacteria-5]
MAITAGTTEDIRRTNLAAILGLLYRGGPASRAALGKRTGRNRSTIGSLVGDLVDLGLVAESDPDPDGQVGRPSPVVSIRPEVTAIAVNPEIDALTIALVGLDGNVRRTIRHEYGRIPTAAEVLSITSAVIAGMQVELDGLLVAGVGVAVPGQVRTSDGVVRNAPHLDWHDQPFGEPLAEATGYRVLVANDAALGALAEHEFGAGRAHDHLIYLNGGASGIGGGVITGGTLLGGAAGYAGELGHVRVSSSGALDSAGFAGTLEAEVTRAELLDALRLPSADPAQFEAALLADRSEAVAAIVGRQLGHLGTALAAAINLFNPEVVALGGFLAALHAYDPQRLEQVVAEAALAPSREGVRITPAELGPNLLMIGAAGLAFGPLLDDPASIS